MQKVRLLKLANFLENNVPAGRFNLSYWVDGNTVDEKKNECGTVGCAMGWAPQCFKRSKLRLLKKDGLYPSPVPEYNGCFGYSAAVAFFNISGDQAAYLFSPIKYNDDDLENPKAVAARIRKLVSENK